MAGHEHAHEHPRRHGKAHPLGHDAAVGPLGRLKHLLGPHNPGAADSVDSELEGSEGNRALKISLVVLGLTAVPARRPFLDQLMALLADTIHDFSDALTALPLCVAFVLSCRATTRRYTYGYGGAWDLSGIFIVAMIALSRSWPGGSRSTG